MDLLGVYLKLPWVIDFPESQITTQQFWDVWLTKFAMSKLNFKKQAYFQISWYLEREKSIDIDFTAWFFFLSQCEE